MEEIEFPLLRWLEQNQDVKYNLASSSIPEISLKAIGKLENKNKLKTDHALLEDLRSEIRNIYYRGCDVIVTSGAQSANSLIYSALLDKGDRVLVENPAYTPLQTAPLFSGCDVDLLERRFEDGFRLDLEMIKENLTKDTKMMVITNPYNPPGIYMESGELRDIQRFLEEENVYLVVDEIYRDFLKDSESAVSLGPNVIVTTSFSKIYGLGGIRIGWAASKDREIIHKLESAKSHIRPSNSVLSERTALLALKERDNLLSRAREIAEDNLAMVKGWMKGMEGIRWAEPAFGVISFPKLDINCSSEEFAERARDKGVLVVPGVYLGMDGGREGHIRLTFGREEPEDLTQGLRILSRVIRECR